jgi:hypothetical protein
LPSDRVFLLRARRRECGLRSRGISLHTRYEAFAKLATKKDCIGTKSIIAQGSECAVSGHCVALVIAWAFEMTPISPLPFGEELRVFIFGPQLV